MADKIVNRSNFLGDPTPYRLKDMGDGTWAEVVYTTGGSNVTYDVQTATVELSSSDILNCFDTPIEIVPALGANKFPQIVSILYVYKFGTTPYTNPGDLGLLINGHLIDGTAGGIVIGSVDSTAGAGFNLAIGAISGILNAPLVFGNDVGNPTDGDGTLIVRVQYTEEDATDLI